MQNFPLKGRGLDHATPKFFDIWWFKITRAKDFKCGTQLHLWKPNGATHK